MRQIEYGIAEILERTGSRLCLAGRCYKGPIRRNDEFDTLYRLIPEPVEDGYDVSRREDEQQVLLRVVNFRAYNQSLDEISEGMTALVEVAGKGLEEVAVTMVLGGEGKNGV